MSQTNPESPKERVVEVKWKDLAELHENLSASVKPRIEFQDDIEKMRTAAFQEMRLKAYQALFIVERYVK